MSSIYLSDAKIAGRPPFRPALPSVAGGLLGPSRLPLGGYAGLDWPCHSGPGGGSRSAVPRVRRMTYNVGMAPKTERLSLRLTPEQDAVLRRAAEARGESANEFVLRHAVEAAQIELADRRVFVADEAAWEEFQALLSRPPALPQAMIKLLSNPSVLEQPS
jgi:uncharacterized protein (DUF1778 family)